MRSSRPRPTPRFGPRAGTAALLAAPLLLGGLVAGSPAGAQTQPARVVLPGTQPAWAAPTADRGEVAASVPVTVRVYLAGRDRAGLAALATAVSDPRSASHGHYLTAAQVKSRFGTTAAQTATVRSWLGSAGFEVVATTPHFLTVRGDATAVRRAFGTPLHSYRKDGRTYRAPAVPATVPASVAADVLSVTGLDSSPHLMRPSSVRDDAPRTGGTGRRDLLPPPGAALAVSGPFSSTFGSTPATGTPKAYGQVQPYALAGYTGAQLRRAYGVLANGPTGAGVTVAVVDAYDSPTLGDDTAAYSAAHHEQPYRPGQLIRVGPADWSHTYDYNPDTTLDGCGASGWYGEQTLDVEAVHGVAPDANILYSAASDCGDDAFTDALGRIVDGRLADIVSNSWGEAEQTGSDPAADPVYDDIFQRGAVEGIGFYVATGDDGDYAAADGAGKQAPMPASLPWVTAVGGTSLATDKNGDYRFETGWGTDTSPLSRDGKSWGRLPGTFSSGAGGGTSARVPEPDYQLKVVPSQLSGANGGRNRVTPDVAAVADPGTGFLVGQTQTWLDNSVHYGEYRIGGTSLATPVFSAIQALAQQAQGGAPLGFANPALYQRYGTAAFHDVTDTPLGASTTLAMVRTDFRNGVNAANGLNTTLRTMGHDSSLQALKGYDNVTGVGSPAAGYLASYPPVPKPAEGPAAKGPKGPKGLSTPRTP
ncbi:protease pro-enzyme activation domain-containing protein [Streptacidiphilus sp. N1-3]|uniref:Protease pro-enzyme activation domain-containing protein n=1 Tax=Streptacidiphilus alkalitolerans TaxID=3342712 RepID=A0ABV6WU79_9ACTN